MWLMVLVSKRYSLFTMKSLLLDRLELSKWSSTTRSSRPCLGEAPDTHVSREDPQPLVSASSQYSLPLSPSLSISSHHSFISSFACCAFLFRASTSLTFPFRGEHHAMAIQG